MFIFIANDSTAAFRCILNWMHYVIYPMMHIFWLSKLRLKFLIIDCSFLKINEDS